MKEFTTPNGRKARLSGVERIMQGKAVTWWAQIKYLDGEKELRTLPYNQI
jgi:hypothetical protein